jgi:hypothetical protein
MKYIIFIITVLVSGNCFAQTDSLTTTAADSIPKAKNTLTLAAVYANNASYFGQRAEETTPYAALAATYQLKSGFYLTGLAYKILTERNPDISAANIGAGVTWNFTKKLSGDLRYTHSFYPTLSPLIQSVNTENISLGLTHNSWLESSVSADYAFGQTNDVFATAGLAKDINLFSIGKKDLVSIKPYASVVGGTQRFYKTYVTEQKVRDSVLGFLPVPVFGNPGSPPGTTETKTVEASSFDLISYNLELPLSYSRAHYVVEAAYKVSVLGEKSQSRPGKVNSFFTLSFYYQL